MSADGLGEYRPYREHKDSDVGWLGKIPAHWETTRIGNSVTGCQNGLWGDEPVGGNGVVCVRVADFDRVKLRVDISDPTYRSIDQRALDRRKLRKGDLLLEKSGGGDNQPVGAVMLYNHEVEAVCSNFIARMPVAEGHDPVYLTYLHFVLYKSRINVRSIKQNTGIQNLDSKSYLNEMVSLPPLPEQQAIGRFLDHKTTEIDNLIAAKKRLITLLQEKRAALITQAVTKGLDPSVPMKDSGIEWLGEIPAHWEMKRLKHVSPNLTVGIVVNPSNYVSDHGVPFLYGSDIKEGQIVTESARRMSPEWSDTLHKSQLHSGDLVTVRVGAPGITAVVPDELEGANCASILIIRRSQLFSSHWLCYTMNSQAVRYQVELVQYGAAQEQFNVAHAVEFLIPFPPLEEQSKIADFLDQRAGEIDCLINSISEGIERLQEYRTALISAAVTGKIDVRDYGA